MNSIMTLDYNTILVAYLLVAPHLMPYANAQRKTIPAAFGPVCDPQCSYMSVNLCHSQTMSLEPIW